MDRCGLRGSISEPGARGIKAIDETMSTSMTTSTTRGAKASGRWTACFTASVFAHAVVVVPMFAGGAWSIAAGPSAPSGLEVRLASPSVTDAAAPPREALEPLATTERVRPYKPRYAALVPFTPVDFRPPAFDEAAYLPGSRLTQRPKPLAQVVVPYPKQASESRLMVARILVFIDEDGSVAKVVSRSHLPPEFEEAARNTFEKARFRPGEIDGRPVKARMLIEVTFDGAERKA
jgi:TonB family protein